MAFFISLSNKRLLWQNNSSLMAVVFILKEAFQVGFGDLGFLEHAKAKFSITLTIWEIPITRFFCRNKRNSFYSANPTTTTVHYIAISLPLANVTSPGKLPIWLEIPRFITPIDKEFSFLCIFYYWKIKSVTNGIRYSFRTVNWLFVFYNTTIDKLNRLWYLIHLCSNKTS